MRRLLVVLGVVALCSAPTWADSVVDINAWATFTAPATGQTETIGINMIYTEPTGANTIAGIFGVVDSLTESSSGFLGTFNAYPGQTPTQGEVAFTNNPTLGGLGHYDEIDLNGFNPALASTGTYSGVKLGVNTVNFDLWSCYSAACTAGYPDTPPHPGPTSQSSVVTRVAVPDGTPFLPLCLSSFGAFGLVWRWRRREV
ncbi:MAG TPA: hypothetical protein VN901_10135 [Candidatus Acidoferrales bacterium]|nr:hypothetical protein [Candidatus Acidoferrales bacterium]